MLDLGFSRLFHYWHTSLCCGFMLHLGKTEFSFFFLIENNVQWQRYLLYNQFLMLPILWCFHTWIQVHLCCISFRHDLDTEIHAYTIIQTTFRICFIGQVPLQIQVICFHLVLSLLGLHSRKNSVKQLQHFRIRVPKATFWVSAEDWKTLQSVWCVTYCLCHKWCR